MNVAELGKDLEVPPSTVLASCTALGIDAAWAGADLTAADVVRIRAALVDDPASDPEQEPAPSSAGAAPVSVPSGEAAPSALPPTAVGSMPGLIEELTPPEDPGPLSPRSTPSPSGAPGSGRRVPTVADDMARSKVRGAGDRSLDPALRPAVVALVLAAVIAAASGFVSLIPAIAACWSVVALLLLVSLLAANRARYRITTHPDQRSGLPLAVAVLVLGLLGSALLGTAIWTVVRSAPADQAPLGLGDRGAVRQMRWGYQRVQLIADHSWSRPARDVGTCWQPEERGAKVRSAGRVEVVGEQVSCDQSHRYEVIEVFAPDRDADSPYPGAAGLEAEGLRTCADRLAELAPGGAAMRIEYPTRANWNDADHDVACVVDAPRKGALGGA